MPTAATHLGELNPEQRRAARHGVRQDCTIGPPLLVIAGAESGKTNTLAHGSRTSFSTAQRPTPVNDLLAVRAAAEMTGRVSHIAGKLGGNNSSLTSA